jgi:hypothetical protein
MMLKRILHFVQDDILSVIGRRRERTAVPVESVIPSETRNP